MTLNKFNATTVNLSEKSHLKWRKTWEILFLPLELMRIRIITILNSGKSTAGSNEKLINLFMTLWRVFREIILSFKSFVLNSVELSFTIKFKRELFCYRKVLNNLSGNFVIWKFLAKLVILIQNFILFSTKVINLFYRLRFFIFHPKLEQGQKISTRGIIASHYSSFA